jgi:hypothetical protein
VGLSSQKALGPSFCFFLSFFFSSDPRAVRRKREEEKNKRVQTQLERAHMEAFLAADEEIVEREKMCV